MIILHGPKGWTGQVDGETQRITGDRTSAFAEMASKPEHVLLLEEWMKSQAGRSFQRERQAD